MKAPEVVQRYAGTLLDAAAETEVFEPVREDVERLIATLDASAELVSFLGDRLIGEEVKGRVLEQLFAGKVQSLTLNFLLLLARRRRVNLLSGILDACVELFDERAGVFIVEVRSAAELSKEQEGHLRARLAAYTGKEIRLRTRIDRKVRGGLIAQVGDTVFDGSLTTHLQRLHRRLAGT
jgi:F-type H+-transporting ATPase subunit delta